MVGLTVNVPLVASVPVQPPLAAQDVAFVLDQLRFELAPEATVVGLADKVAVGAGEVADALVVQPILLKYICVGSTLGKTANLYKEVR